jgi:hypothetical protein
MPTAPVTAGTPIRAIGPRPLWLTAVSFFEADRLALARSAAVAACRPELRPLAPRLLAVRRAVLSRLFSWLRLVPWLRPALWRAVVLRELALDPLALRPAAPRRLELC